MPAAAPSALETLTPGDQAELVAAVREAVDERTPLFPLGGGTQEMLTMVAPEPSAVLLVSTGLLGIVGLARIRRRGKKQD